METIVIGGGLAGLSAAKTLTQNGYTVTIIEKECDLGGLLRTDYKYGCYFDHGPHLFFHEDEVFVNAFKQSVGINGFLKKPAKTGQWSYDTLIDFPYSLHLHGLPENIISKCVCDYVERRIDSKNKNDITINNYEEYCRFHFGDGFTDYFMKNYATKIWTVDPIQLDVDWVGPRIVLPDYKEVIKGALKKRTFMGNYIKEFRYPKEGGTQHFFEGYLNSMSKEKVNIMTSAEIEQINLEKKYVVLKNGEKLYYENIISTIPLPELINIVFDLPIYIKDALSELIWFGVLLLNYVSKEIIDNTYQWIYFDQTDTIFHRIHYPTKLYSDENNKTSSLQAEISFSKYRELPGSVDTLLERVWDELYKTKFASTKDIPNSAFGRKLEYAYVIMDHQRSKRVGLIRSYFENKSFIICGRFGEWDYIWTDKVLKSGMEAAYRVMQNTK